MKRWLRSLFCLFMAVAMVFSLTGAAFAAEELQEDAPHDFVILLDCSGSLRANDPDDLCLASFKSFVDQMPSQNARVAVLGFGYTNGPRYTYGTEIDPDFTGDAEWVHEIVPMSDLSSQEDKETYKEMVEKVYFQKKQGKKTPIGQAVSAGLDVLKKSGSADENACIILITDGIDIPSRRLFSPTQAAPDAKEHGWPIYCIGLNYNGGDPAEIAKAQELLQKYCTISGNDTLAPQNCATPADVSIAFDEIFADFFGVKLNVIMLKLPGDFTFEVPAMTSEATIKIFGEGVESVTLTHTQTGETYTITESIVRGNLEATKEQDKYFVIKLIVPTEGTWNAHLEGKGNAEIRVSQINIQEMGIKMVSNPIQAGADLTKNDRIRVNACFAYREFEVHNTGFYAANPAELLVHSSNGTTQVFDMEATKDGYSFDLPLSEVPSGPMEIQVSVKHSMFRNGRKLSNIDRYSTENKPLDVIKPVFGPVEVDINHPFELDMKEIFENPDNDPITYTVTCISDRNQTFAHEVKEDYITFDAGYVPGTFELEITAIDPDMVTPVKSTGTVIVTDHAPEVKSMPDVELWVNCYGFQGDAKKNDVKDLAEYLWDPDGVEMAYTVEADAAVLTVKQNGTMLELLPVAEGETVVRITGNDKVSDVTTEFEVKVIDGKIAFWRDNWIYFAIALAIIVAIILTIIILIKNKRVKGNWEITIEENGVCGSIPSMNIADYTSVGKKGKFLLKDLVLELLPYLDYPMVDTKIISYFSGNGSDKIELVGVVRKKGCTVAKIPANGGNVIVSNNGVSAKGKTSVYGGTLTVIIDSTDGFGGRLMVTMRLL